jgi:tetraacyldisaccharide 4'-kinase
MDKQFTLVTGIADPKPLLAHLEQLQYRFKHEKFPDHHTFSTSEIKKLSERDIILTTEKDYMRLQPHLEKFALYYLPIKTVLFNDQEDFFHDRILSVMGKKA